MSIIILIAGPFAPVQLCKCHLSLSTGEFTLNLWQLNFHFKSWALEPLKIKRPHIFSNRWVPFKFPTPLEPKFQDKFYDVSYDTGDKSVQCGRKVDAFKLWFMLKVWLLLDLKIFTIFPLQARGEDYMEGIVDNTFAMTDYLEELVMDVKVDQVLNTDLLQVRGHPGFRLVPAYSTRQCTNLGFWYIPERWNKHVTEIKWS